MNLLVKQTAHDWNSSQKEKCILMDYNNKEYSRLQDIIEIELVLKRLTMKKIHNPKKK